MNALAVSDAVLAACAMLAIAMTLRAQPLRVGLMLAIAGWSALACAAVLGAVRYGAWPEVEPLHRGASDLAASAGMPSVVCGLCLALVRSSRLAWLAVAVPLAGLVLLPAFMHDAALSRTAGAVLTLSGALALLALALKRRQPRAALLAALAVLLLILAAAAAAAAAARERDAGGLVLLHYALAGAQLAWLMVWRSAGDHRRTQHSERLIKQYGGVRIDGQMPT